MIQFSSDFTEIFNAVFELPVFRFFLLLLPFSFFPIVLHSIFRLLGLEPDPIGFFAASWKCLSDKVVTWLCSTEKGFKLAYKLGWARPGVDFFDCAVHCDTCPKYAACNSDKRVVFDDVSHADYPGSNCC